MTILATAVWRVRPSGVNTNGGGYDCGISAAATGTHGSFTGTTFTDATAAAFTSGMVNRSINITGIGQYKITAFIDASNITLGSGNPVVALSGGMAWTVGAGTDYSQQDAAQATGSNATAAQNSTTFVDATANAFTSAMVGNAIWIASGTNFNVGAYFVTGFTSASTVTLDRAPATAGAGSVGVWKLGGGWADFWTNTTSTGPLVNNNTVYILGSGTPNPASYTYDYTPIQFAPTGNPILYANDPSTPGYKAPPNTTGGMPVIKFNVASSVFAPSGGVLIANGLWFVGTTTAAGNYVFQNVGTAYSIALNGCVLDQFSFDVGLLNVPGGGVNVGQGIAIGSEVFSSVAPGSAGTKAAFAGVTATNAFISLTGCNIHDCVGFGVISGNFGGGLTIINSIIAKCQADGAQISHFGGGCIQNCTIDGNLGNGITLFNQRQNYIPLLNNIFSNHTGGGKFGVSSNTVSLAQFFDYNVYYNNTADLNNLSYGSHDTHGGANPYVAQASENYTLV